MLNQFSRTQLLLGPEAMECLAEARVAVFGVVDAIDTVKGKLALVEQAQAAHTPVICSMGAGSKLDPTAFRVADIYQTSVCPLARVMLS